MRRLVNAPASDVIAINQEGQLTVSKVSRKAFFGKNILHIDVYNRAEPNALAYCVVYRDGRTGPILGTLPSAA